MKDKGADAVRELFKTGRLKEHLKILEEYANTAGVPLEQVLQDAFDRYLQTHKLKKPN
jgi:hypothetical protein